MLFKYKLKNKWYSVDIPKEEYDTFLDLTFADKLKYIKLLKQQQQAEEGADEVSNDLGFSILGTKKATSAPSQTIEQLQEKETKRMIAKKKMAELTKIEEEINNKVKAIESKPDAEPDISLLEQMEKLLEQRDLLVREIQTLNVENVAVMNVKSVDTLNIKGINKLVSDMNSSNITETFKQVKEELDKVYKSFGDKEITDKLNEVTKDFINDFNTARNNDFNDSEARLYAVLKKLSELLAHSKHGNSKMLNYLYNNEDRPAPAFDENGNVLLTFDEFGEIETNMALCVELLLAYNQNSNNDQSVINVIRWNYKDNELNEVKTLVGTIYTLPVGSNDPQLREALKEMVIKCSRYSNDKDRPEAKKKLEEFKTIIKNILYIKEDIKEIPVSINGNVKKANKAYGNLISVLENTQEIINKKLSNIDSVETRKLFEGTSADSDNEGEGVKKGFFSDMMLKKLEEKLKKIENKINELKGTSSHEIVNKDTVKEDSAISPVKKRSDLENGFVIPKLNHVEPVIKPQFDDEYKDLKDVLERRRKDIEYSDDDISDESISDWTDDESYTELTAGSLKDATELIESLRDNYNIVLRMYINKRKK